jgi:hypothetical protein
VNRTLFGPVALISVLLLPSIAHGEELGSPARAPILLQSGIALLRALPLGNADALIPPAQLQQTKLKTMNSRRAKVILITVIAAAAVVYVLYELDHMDGSITLH